MSVPDREALLRPGTAGFDDWCKFDDALEFLEESLHGSVPVYLSLHSPQTSVFLAAVFIPVSELTSEARNELLGWNTSVVDQKWGYGGGFHEDGSPDYSLIPPFAWERPAVLQKAVPIIWRRENALEKGRPTYYEANPEITHVHDLHWVEERSAYCTLDEIGEVREVIRIKSNPKEDRIDEITVEDDVLAKHMALGSYALVRFFDIDRYHSIQVAGAARPDHDAAEQITRRSLRARLTPTRRTGNGLLRAYLRGVQLANPPRGEAKKALLADRHDRRYVTFIAQDFKHDRIAELSCAPDELDNYFTDTGKPFETTPAFFRREVLLKYQSDSDKYTVRDREISCRSTWSLRFDVNEEGQVHAYLYELQRLPYAEQQYWRAFNEEPKGPISKRSFKTDFEGSWDIEPEPLSALKARLGAPIKLSLSATDSRVIWAPSPNPHALDDVHYLAGVSQKEWGQAIGALHRLVVEGLQESVIRKLAVALGEDAKALEPLRSIKLLERVLSRLGLPGNAVTQIVQPLTTLTHLRNKTSSHRSGDELGQLVRQARRDHGDLAKHFKALVLQINDAMHQLATACAGVGGQQSDEMEDE